MKNVPLDSRMRVGKCYAYLIDTSFIIVPLIFPNPMLYFVAYQVEHEPLLYTPNSLLYAIFYNCVVRKKKELMNKIFTTSTIG